MRVLRTLFLLMSVASCPFVMSGKAAKTAKSHVDEAAGKTQKSKDGGFNTGGLIS